MLFQAHEAECPARARACAWHAKQPSGESFTLGTSPSQQALAAHTDWTLPYGLEWFNLLNPTVLLPCLHDRVGCASIARCYSDVQSVRHSAVS